MSRNKSLNKKIQKAVDELLGDGELFGFEFDDVITNGRRVTASGDALGTSDVDLVVNFNKQARPIDITISTDLRGYNTRIIQGYEFSNYKKYEKSMKKERFENLYARAVNYFGKGTEREYQKGVDLMESIPGIDDVFIQVISADIQGFYVT